MQRKYIAFVNPSTRGNANHLLAHLHRAAPADAIIMVHETTVDAIDPSVLQEIGDIEAVIAVGGDGTVAAVATAIGDRDLPLAILPGGSTNIIARGLGIPSAPRKAAELIFGSHKVRAIDVGICGDKRFLHMAGAGFDSRLFLATNRGLKRRMGWLAYLPGAARSVSMPPARFTISVDGNVIELMSPLILIANGAAIIHPRLEIYPHINNDDGLLDVIIFSATDSRGVFRSIMGFATRSLPKSKDVLRLQGRTIILSAEPAMPVQLDGDVVGETPAHFSLSSRRLKIVTPRKTRD
jgi:diacylglycerol kinase (ATP)